MTEAGTARALYRGALFAVALVILALLVVFLRWVLVEVFVSIIIAAGMAPLVRSATDRNRQRPWKWRPPRALVVVGIYIGVVAVLFLLGSVLVAAVARSAQSLEAQLPDFTAEIQSWVNSLTEAFPWLSNVDVQGAVGGGAVLTQWLTGFVSSVMNIAGVLLSFFGSLITVVFVMFMALYITVDAESMRDYLLVFFPASRQEMARRIVTNISFRLGHWVVGQLVLMVIIGGGAAIGLGLIGVPGAAILGVIWALAEFIPGIGPFVSAVPSILFGFLAGPAVGIAAAIFTLAWSQIESNVITPRVMGRAVEVNPLVVLLSLLVGNELLGFAGMLISIPAAAAIAVIVDELHQVRLRHLQETAADGSLEKVLVTR
jgi:predicted PurR-regulated permease PerM